MKLQVVPFWRIDPNADDEVDKIAVNDAAATFTAVINEST